MRSEETLYAFPGFAALPFFTETESWLDKAKRGRQSSKNHASRMARNLRKKVSGEKKKLLFIPRHPWGTYEISFMFSNTLDIRDERLEKLRSFAKTLVLQLFLASPDSEKS